MRRLANFYLVAFAADAVVSVLDDLLAIVAGSDALSLPRNGVAVVVVAASLPVYAGVVATPRVAASVFVPPILLLGWIALGAMPLPLYLDERTAGAWLGVAQLAVATGMLLRTRALCAGRSWLFDGEAWSGLAWRPVHTAAMVGASVIGIPVLLAGYLAMSAALAVDAFTAGFVRLAPDGLYTEQREYRRGGHRVYLVGMVHIGDPGFYDEVLADLVQPGTVLLVEGVTDERERLQTGFSYKALSEALGLAAQEEHMAVFADDLEVIHADVDLADFSPETVDLLNRVARVLAHETLPEILAAYLELARSPVSRETLDRMWRELIRARDAHAFAELEVALDRYHRAILPWGAAHMPGLESRLFEAGFELGDARELRAVTF